MYESNQSIKAIDYADPLNPITVEPANTTLQGVTAAPVHQFFGNPPEKSYAANGVLVYAKDGKLWIIDHLIDGKLSPRQLSNENNAFNLCSAILNATESSQNLQNYQYTFPGLNGACFDQSFYQDAGNYDVWLPLVSDNLNKKVSLDTNINTTPDVPAINSVVSA
ncbi:MAG: hypothetical protein L0Z73_11960 [Gammaproteobacteria bacterium]|nr:hypothetical protein [Gammaproteobacteria bacterium]